MSAPSEQEVREALAAAIRDVTRGTCGNVADSDLLHDGLGIDSLQSVELTACVERYLSATLPPGSERRLADAFTVGELVACITEILRENDEAP